MTELLSVDARQIQIRQRRITVEYFQGLQGFRRIEITVDCIAAQMQRLGDRASNIGIVID